MRLDWWTIALQTVNFAVLVWLLQHFLYTPVLRMIDARRADVQRQYDAVKAAKDEAQAGAAAIEAQRAGIATERDAAMKAAATQAQQAAEARRVQADRDAQTLLDNARKTIDTERARALEQAKRLALDLGSAAAQRLLAEIPMPLRAEAWMERIEQRLAALPIPELESLKAQLTRGGELTVVTAVSLTPASAEAWRERLRHALGESASIVFAVDPGLLAGTELHFSTAIVRLSWQTILTTMQSEAEPHVDVA